MRIYSRSRVAPGLRVPRTLVTSDPGEARRFIEEIGVGKVVFKAFLASVEDWRETRLVESSDEAAQAVLDILDDPGAARMRSLAGK